MEDENAKSTDSEDVNDTPTPEPEKRDPADEIPVPIAMSAAEVDERAQAVEAVREAVRETPQAISDDELQP